MSVTTATADPTPTFADAAAQGLAIMKAAASSLQTIQDNLLTATLAADTNGALSHRTRGNARRIAKTTAASQSGGLLKFSDHDAKLVVVAYCFSPKPVEKYLQIFKENTTTKAAARSLHVELREQKSLGDVLADLPGAAPDPRPTVFFGSDNNQFVEDCCKVLGDEDVYVQDDKFLALIDSPTGKRFREVTSAHMMKSILDRYMRFEVYSQKAEGMVPFRLSTEAASAVLNSPDFPEVKPLTAVITAPALLSDGTILSREGYDPETGLFYQNTPGHKYPAFPENPTEAQIDKAIATINDLYDGFSFTDEHSRAAALAMPFEMCSARFLRSGKTPMYVYTAAFKGSGKSTCMVLGQIAATGEYTTHSWGQPEERIKHLNGILRGGAPGVFWDNVRAPRGSKIEDSDIERLLTSGFWSARTLGVTDDVKIESRATLAMSLNGGEFIGDMERRLLKISMNKLPENNDFKHKEIEKYAQEHHPQILWSLLTLWRAWLAVDEDGPKPGRVRSGDDQDLPAWREYKGWQRCVRSLVVYFWGLDPVGDRERVEGNDDDEETSFWALVDAWPAFARTPETAIRVGALAHLAQPPRRGIMSGGVPKDLRELPVLSASDAQHLREVSQACVPALGGAFGDDAWCQKMGYFLRTKVDAARSSGGPTLRRYRSRNGAAWTYYVG